VVDSRTCLHRCRVELKQPCMHFLLRPLINVLKLGCPWDPARSAVAQHADLTAARGDMQKIRSREAQHRE
jgi:hypothetical protein